MDLKKRTGAIGSSLFKQGKESEEVLAAKERQRLGLLKSISRSIKEVQVMFANQLVEHPSQAYIGDCRPAQRLCAEFEEILRHGLKAGWFGSEVTFWPIVLKVSRKQAVQYIKGLQYAQTDNGRCRAWIRLAVNECSLESYINVLCQDSKLLSSYYESYSFVRSHEMVTALTQLLVGLTELTFKLTVDTASLEFEAAPEAVNTLPLKLRVLDDSRQSNKGKEKKGLKVSSESKDSLSSYATEEMYSNNDIISLEQELVTDQNSSELVSSERPPPLEVFNEPLEGVVSDIVDPSEPTPPPVSEPIPAHTDTVGDELLPSEDKDMGVFEKVETMVYTDDDTVPCPSDQPEASPTHSDVQHDQQDDHQQGDLQQDDPQQDEPQQDNSQQDDPQQDDHQQDDPQQDDHQQDDHQQGDSQQDDPQQNEPQQDDPQQDDPQQGEPQQDDPQQDEQISQELGVEQATSITDPPPAVSQSMEDTLATFHDLSLVDVVQPSLIHKPGTVSSSIQAGPAVSYHNSKAPYSGLVMEELFARKPTDETVTHNLATAPSEQLPTDKDQLESSIPETELLATQNTSNTEHGDELLPANPLEVKKSTNPFSSEPEDPSNLEFNDSSELDPNKRVSIVSQSTLVNDDDVSSLDFDGRGSRETTPIRRGTNPFSDWDDEEDVSLNRRRFVTNPFADDDSYLPSQEAQNRPVSFQIPPPSSQARLSSNPFGDNDITPMNDDKPTLQSQTSVDSVDTPTIEHFLPPINQTLALLSEQRFNETTPSISPDNFYKEQSPDTVSTVSSQDLSLVLDAGWESVSFSAPLGNSLSPTEDHFGAETGKSELMAEIGRLKAQLRNGAGGEDKAELRKKVVTLQMRVQQIQETEEEKSGDTNHQEVFGHRLVKQPRQRQTSGTPPTCEGCRKQVRGLIRVWYLCKTCGCACHKGCMSKVTRRCNQFNKIKEDTTYSLTVCPEIGLTRQKFRCGSCTQSFTGPHSGGARLCDYTGLYHCKHCHHNDEVVIPARVLHNWDFKPRKVCCQCFDLLTQLSTKATVEVTEGNSLLYPHVTDLSSVEDLRKDLLVMKNYFIQCRLARDAQLLQHCNQLLHFKDNPHYYSLPDLAALQDGTLLPRLQDAHKDYTNHIKECLLCSGKGYLCESCGSEEILFPFDKHTSQCSNCKSVFHSLCFNEMSSCPRCTRIKERPKI